MNSLNFVAARVSPQTTPVPSRSNSYGNALSLAGATDVRRSSKGNILLEREDIVEEAAEGVAAEDGYQGASNEKTPLLDHREQKLPESKPSHWFRIPHGIAGTIISSLRWMFSTLVAPGVYLIACLYDERGNFAPSYRVRKLWTGTSGMPNLSEVGHTFENGTGQDPGRRSSVRTGRRVPFSGSSSSGLSSESESERDLVAEDDDRDDFQATRQTRSKSSQSSDEIAPARRSIRIKLHNEDSLRQRKYRKAQSVTSQSNGSGAISTAEISPATLKSPTSPASSHLVTKYPRAPAPPRPLIPRRQPSYSHTDSSNGRLVQKTLILDLDETLIHSMAKGGRMSTGHMVEVKLNTYIGIPGQASIGPQHPILYYVHKRPFCDEFLRRVCKWYNLVIFTASVQEYADPVIDWLEQERKFFSGRFYRQHCTYRNGAFIKDLTSVEPDLSKVMILDNSPLSYMFHQDNAIPIEGWINDPTDNDLLHLVPLLEALQFSLDVRSILALRGGEDGKHMTA